MTTYLWEILLGKASYAKLKMQKTQIFNFIENFPLNAFLNLFSIPMFSLFGSYILRKLFQWGDLGLGGGFHCVPGFHDHNNNWLVTN